MRLHRRPALLAAGAVWTVLGCDPVAAPDVDGGDATLLDAPTLDGTVDGGPFDAGPADASADAGLTDAPIDVLRSDMDASEPDAGEPDAGEPDAGEPDAGMPDAGMPDAGMPDAGEADAGEPDAGTPDAPSTFCGDGDTESPEVCDDGNTVTETACPYGTLTCSACDATCAAVLSLTGGVCGDARIDGPEECDVTASTCTACDLDPLIAITRSRPTPHFGPWPSSDGRFVVWHSGGVGIDPRDSTSSYDIYRHDVALGTTTLVTASADGLSAGNGDSTLASMSGDAELVVFASRATNLDPADTDAALDVYVWSAASGSLVTITAATGAGAFADQPRISADGGSVVYRTNAMALSGAPGDHIVVHDLASSTRTLVTVDRTGAPGAGGRSPSISGSGQLVAFESADGNLVDGDANGLLDVFVRDVVRGTTERVSVASDGAEGGGDSRAPVISSDGRWVAFVSAASNLVPGDTNGIADVFVHDRTTRTTVRASVTSTGAEGTSAVRLALTGMTDTGLVVFGHSSALVPTDGNGLADSYAYDVTAGTITLLTERAAGGAGDGFAEACTITPDGAVLFFQTGGSNLLASPVSPSGSHIYRRER